MRWIGATLFIIALLAGVSSPALAQSNDEILRRLDALEKSNAALKKENATLRSRVSKLEGSAANNPASSAAAPTSLSQNASVAAAPAETATIVTEAAMNPTDGYYRPAAVVPPPGTALYSWTGFYWGGSLGGGVTHSRVTSNERYSDTFPTNPPPFVTQGQSIVSEAEGHDNFGGLIDLYLGGNKQIAPSLVVGFQIEGSVGDMNFDAQGSRAITYFNDAGPTGQTASGSYRPHLQSPFMVSALARAGWLADPTTMIYALAGWTGAQFNYTDVTDNLFFQPKDQFWANGVTVGGGLEKKLAPNWSTRFEYRYTKFAASDVSNDFQWTSNFPGSQTNTIRTRFSEDMQIGRIGISYLLQPDSGQSALK